MPALLKNRDETISLLEDIARILELKGESVFKVRAYTNGARTLETFTGDFEELIASQSLSNLPGMGDALTDKITTFVTTGSLPYFDELKRSVPEGLFDLFELQGLGPKKIKTLWEQLNITTLESLETAAKDGSIAALKGFGTKTASNLLESIEAHKRYAHSYRFNQIAPLAEHLREQLRELDEVIQVEIAGSYRRRKEIVRDVDFIVSSNTPEPVMAFFTSHPQVESILVQGPTKSSVRLKIGIQADLRVVSNTQFPFALNYFTGSKEHNILIRQRALDKGWTLNEYRLAQDPKQPDAPLPPENISTEADLYRALGLDFIEPELREATGEVEAAETHSLPRLVELTNIRGTFHCHTTASDGRSSLREMVDAALDHGLQYLGISDHSRSSVQARGLSESQLLEQVAAIRQLNTELAPDFRIFTGVECDILKDGSLDYPDEILAQLDYIVASVHNAFEMNESAMTDRIIRALENPHVTMLGHLSGRLLLSREAYALDIPRVIDSAARTGTWIELNGNGRRLDMDWRFWPLAKRKGVRCVINPDAHHVTQFQNLSFGTNIARKGGLTKADVMNCLPLAQMEIALQQKRKQSGIAPPLP
jgi:DNA polymerase (family 10)